ncbi:MAG: hypothetical protein PHV42_03160 [Candidatus Pacebacteria bacterium]|nr:hypothetical protein [Candidatus Paceibacterota bacterium]
MVALTPAERTRNEGLLHTAETRHAALPAEIVTARTALTSAETALTTANTALATRETELAAAQTLLTTRETELAAAQTALTAATGTPGEAAARTEVANKTTFRNDARTDVATKSTARDNARMDVGAKTGERNIAQTALNQKEQEAIRVENEIIGLKQSLKPEWQKRLHQYGVLVGLAAAAIVFLLISLLRGVTPPKTEPTKDVVNAPAPADTPANDQWAKAKASPQPQQTITLNSDDAAANGSGNGSFNDQDITTIDNVPVNRPQNKPEGIIIANGKIIRVVGNSLKNQRVVGNEALKDIAKTDRLLVRSVKAGQKLKVDQDASNAESGRIMGYLVNDQEPFINKYEPQVEDLERAAGIRRDEH